MANPLYSALVLLTIFVGVVAVEIQLQQQSAAASATQSHATALAHALKSKRRRSKKVEASLRGLGNSKEVAQGEEDEEDDDDDDDDEENAKTAPQPVAAGLLNSKVPEDSGPGHAAFIKGVSVKDAAPDDEKAAKEKQAEAARKAEADRKADADRKAKAAAHEEAEKKVEEARKAQEKAEREIKKFKDEEAFDAKIATETKLMTNETQSPALASFLGALRTEVREYAMPQYPAYLSAKLDAANKKLKVLEWELKAKEQQTAPQPGPQGPAAAAKKPEEETAEEAAKKTMEKQTTEEEKAMKPALAESGGESKDKKAGEAFALSFFANTAMLATIFAMATSDDDTVKNYTWFIMDSVIAIFLAVLYINAFASLLHFHNLAPHHEVMVAWLHVIVMVAVVLGLAASLKKKKVAMAILCGAGAHVLSFSTIHAAAASQNGMVSMSYTYTMCVLGICMLIFTFLALGFLLYSAKKRAQLDQDGEYMDATDDLEKDFVAMALSVVITMLVRFVITGYHPVDDGSAFKHTQAQRNAMLFWALACLVIAGFVTVFCSKKIAEQPDNYPLVRVLSCVISIVTMNVAWATLYWGEWEFFEALYPNEALKGKLMFAICMTMVGALGIFGLAKMGVARQDAEGRTVRTNRKVALTALALLIGFSWEHTFDSAMEGLVDGDAHPAGLKILATILMGAIVIPVYALKLKPISSKAEEAIGA